LKLEGANYCVEALKNTQPAGAPYFSTDFVEKVVDKSVDKFV
jgi:hypothetical protein